MGLSLQCEKALEINPRNALAHYNLAAVLGQKGRADGGPSLITKHPWQ